MKMWKVTLTSLLLVLVAILPACRTRRTPPPVVTQTTAEPRPPIVVDPPARSETAVQPEDDFVTPTAEPREDILPADMDELNRLLHERGSIRDAYFTYDEATLDTDAQANLSASATWLKSREGSGYNLLIEGHCDERGTEQYNLALGDRRANTAKDYLVTLGVEANRIRTVSYGEERPFDAGHDDSAWRQNRRAHLVLVR